MTALERARWLRDARGFSVIPLDHPADTWLQDPKKIGKTPAIAWKPFQARRPTDAELAAWFENGHQRNVAIVTGAISGVVVVDGDSPEALDWMRAHLPPTAMGTATHGGRQHWYFAHPGGTIANKTRIRTDDPAVLLDVRADGGFVVAPGSSHVSGATYERLGPWPTVDVLPRFDPAWLQGAAAETEAGPTGEPSAPEARLRRARAYLEAMGPAIEGQGGDAHTLRAALACRDFDLSDADTLHLLRAWNAGCVPPWTEAELAAKVANAWKYAKRGAGTKAADRPAPGATGTPSEPPGQAPRSYPWTDSGNAERFTDSSGERVRFDHAAGAWLVWDRHRFRRDDNGHVDRLAKLVVRHVWREAQALEDPDKKKALTTWALKSESRDRRAALLTLAARELPIAESGTAWDADPFLLGVANGVLDLRAGRLRPGTPADRITKAVPIAFDADAACSRWERFLAEICNDDTALVTFVRRAIGYTLTGAVSEEVWFLLIGRGSNGKSTLLRVLGWLLGEYSLTVPFSVFTLRRNDDPENLELGQFPGKRLITASETIDGKRFDESRLKSLTGGDRLTGRLRYGHPFEFDPTAKLWLSANHRPKVQDDSPGFWRRARVVVLDQEFPNNDRLKTELRRELPGILRWAVAAALEWQREGLPVPQAVSDATENYRQTEDHFRQFVQDAVTLDLDATPPTPGVSVRLVKEVRERYTRWCDQNGIDDRDRLTSTGFGRRVLELAGVTADRITGARAYRGLALAPEGG